MERLAGPWPAISWRADENGRLSLSDEQATALYRMAQEAVASALKHADAQHVAVTLDTAHDGVVRLCIADDGVGMPPSALLAWTDEHHYGLAGMQERATMINAELHVDSTPGEGTRVVVEVKP